MSSAGSNLPNTSLSFASSILVDLRITRGQPWHCVRLVKARGHTPAATWLKCELLAHGNAARGTTTLAT